MFMTVKTITVTEDAYNAISQLKGPEESFSHLFRRLSKKLEARVLCRKPGEFLQGKFLKAEHHRSLVKWERDLPVCVLPLAMLIELEENKCGYNQHEHH